MPNTILDLEVLKSLVKIFVPGANGEYPMYAKLDM